MSKTTYVPFPAEFQRICDSEGLPARNFRRTLVLALFSPLFVVLIGGAGAARLLSAIGQRLALGVRNRAGRLRAAFGQWRRAAVAPKAQV